MRCHAVNTGIM